VLCAWRGVPRRSVFIVLCFWVVRRSSRYDGPACAEDSQGPGRIRITENARLVTYSCEPVDGLAPRLGFFAVALVGSPLVVWLAREAIYELDGTTFWIWTIGLPALVTMAAGGLMRTALWELVLGASLSVLVAWLSLIVTIVVGCSGRSDCLGGSSASMLVGNGQAHPRATGRSHDAHPRAHPGGRKRRLAGTFESRMGLHAIHAGNPAIRLSASQIRTLSRSGDLRCTRA
jgi:hypothetical protein